MTQDKAEEAKQPAMAEVNINDNWEGT